VSETAAPAIARERQGNILDGVMPENKKKKEYGNNPGIPDPPAILNGR
jgi:hypothetical protein